MISVIVPIYNTKQYLEKCIESIRAQTYKDLEILLIDDGSTDGSSEICDYYAKEDARIKVIHKPNGGLSSARNRGIDEARGDYIGFVDSDDDIEPEMFETLYNLITQFDTDISACRSNFLQSYEDKKSCIDERYPEVEVICTKEACNKLLLKTGCSDAIWDKLFRASLFDEIRMIEGMIYEDQEVVIRLFAKANTIVLTNKRLHNYYRRPGSESITQGKITEKRHDLLEARIRMHKTIKETYPEIEPAARNRYLEAALKFLYDSRTLPEHTRIRKDTKAEINAFIKEHGGIFQRKDIMLCLIAMKMNLKLLDFLFAVREKRS